MRHVLFVFLLSCHVAAQAPDAQPPPERWATEIEIIQLAWAIDLTNFPIKQKDLPRQLPLPPRQGYAGGKSARSPEGSEATIYALTDPSLNAGFYALRVVLALPQDVIKSTSDLPNLEVTSAELLFVCQPSIWFSVSFLSPHRQAIEALRSQMQRERLTPKEVIERQWSSQPQFYFQSQLTEKPNKAPEPTSGSVTPRATEPQSK